MKGEEENEIRIERKKDISQSFLEWVKYGLLVIYNENGEGNKKWNTM